MGKTCTKSKLREIWYKVKTKIKLWGKPGTKSKLESKLWENPGTKSKMEKKSVSSYFSFLVNCKLLIHISEGVSVSTESGIMVPVANLVTWNRCDKLYRLGMLNTDNFEFYGTQKAHDAKRQCVTWGPRIKKWVCKLQSFSSLHHQPVMLCFIQYGSAGYF